MTQNTITAKYAGRCTKCGQRFPAGEQIKWTAGVGAEHATCPAQPKFFGANGGLVSKEQWENEQADRFPAYARDLKAQREADKPAGAGVYRKDGRIYVVKPNKEKTRFYAKEIVPSAPRMTEDGEKVDFEAQYRPGMVYNLTESDRWDWAEASAFLTKYARCIVCGRNLKAAKSVEQAVGPVCVKYFAHHGHVHAEAA